MNGISTASGDMVLYAFLAADPQLFFCPFSLRSSPNPSGDTHQRTEKKKPEISPLCASGIRSDTACREGQLPLVPRAFCPQPRQTIRILRQRRKLPLIHSMMCSSNQYPAHPVKKKVFRAPLVRLSHFTFENWTLCIVMGVVS